MNNYAIKSEVKEVKYEIYKKEDFKDVDNFDFFLQDVVYTLMDEEASIEVLYITEIFIDKDNRNKNYGSEILQELIKENEDKLIIVASYLAKKEYLEEPSNELYNEVLEKLNNFFVKNGFINTNKYFGQYEYKETFMYDNDVFKKNILKHMK